tara:strand:+ start:258 stop:731 length:474 start_codon:yes stop_codon:yes gene_type:complete
MAIKNIAWQSIEPGQIVTFVYKGKKEKSGFKRTVLCINPEIVYKKKNGRTTKFFVGLQIASQGEAPMVSARLQAVISRLGGLEKEGGVVGAQMDENLNRAETEKIVSQLKPFYKFYRTYNLRECRKRRVILEVDYKKIPKEQIKKLESDAMRGIDED